MEFKELLFFKKTAELEHMTKAADELLVAESYLSKKISDLERELGVTLFNRVGRGINLSLSGKVLYNRVLQITNEINDAVKEVKATSEKEQMKLMVVTNVSPYMPSLLKSVADNFPEIRITQLSTTRNEIIKLLQNGDVDFALCSPPIENDDEFETIYLRKEFGVMIFPEGHRFKNRKEISIEELKDETFVCAAKGYGARELLDFYFSRKGLELNAFIETGDTSSVFKYVENGLGVAAQAITAVLWDPIFKNSYTHLSDQTGGEVALTWRRNQFLNNAGKAFIDAAKEYFDSLQQFVEEKCQI